MSKNLLLAIAAAFTAAANEIESPAAPSGDTAAPIKPTESTEGTTEQPKRRGRPLGTTATEKPAPAETGEATDPTDDERFQGNRELIAPLVKGGQGEDVKKVIGKYSKGTLKELPAASQADFEKDIEALSY